MTNEQKIKQEEGRKILKKLIKPSGKIGIIIKGVSANGICKRMRVINGNQDISYWVANLCDLSLNDKGLKITGRGMDMTFWLADRITRELYQGKRPLALKGNGGDCLDWFTV